MTFGQAISTVFRKYVDFSGYATRSEYWWFALFNGLMWLGTKILDAIVGSAVDAQGFAVFNTLWLLAVLLPGLAVMVRRLRDAGYAWGFVFLLLIPIAGSIVVVVLLCQPTKPRVATLEAPLRTSSDQNHWRIGDPATPACRDAERSIPR